ncbi:MAG TPA: HAMP domain-containing sensor histidine kinase [Longimicrobiaceae bacterium]|jgi:signal transduction histidine kinase|nr:HAMP domain-containing sensor histidine kinase [Longimicrobiaceae bacterium]
MLLLLAAAGSSGPLPDPRVIFFVNLVVVVSVVVFAVGVFAALLRRTYQRRVEEEKLAAIGTATARILHQIKNPLQTIVLHADLLLDRAIVEDPASRQDVCDAIVGESQRLVAMLDELSVYASGSRRALSRQPLALHDLVRQVAGNETREAAGTGLRVDGTGIREAVVYGDAYYLHQVLDNLVRNAREAMEGQDDRRLRLGVDRVGAMAAVTVADNGPGIAPDKAERIFQPFVSTKGKGMGLGLAICKEIVEGHAGRLEVQSREGEGTSFTILLPLYGEGTVAGALAAGDGEAAWT